MYQKIPPGTSQIPTPSNNKRNQSNCPFPQKTRSNPLTPCFSKSLKTCPQKEAKAMSKIKAMNPQSAVKQESEASEDAKPIAAKKAQPSPMEIKLKLQSEPSKISESKISFRIPQSANKCSKMSS